MRGRALQQESTYKDIDDDNWIPPNQGSLNGFVSLCAFLHLKFINMMLPMTSNCFDLSLLLFSKHEKKLCKKHCPIRQRIHELRLPLEAWDGLTDTQGIDLQCLGRGMRFSYNRGALFH